MGLKRLRVNLTKIRSVFFLPFRLRVGFRNVGLSFLGIIHGVLCDFIMTFATIQASAQAQIHCSMVAF